MNKSESWCKTWI